MIAYYMKLVFERKIFVRAVRVALLVGVLLNLINNPWLFYAFSIHELNLGRVLLTFLVPYCVST